MPGLNCRATPSQANTRLDFGEKKGKGTKETEIERLRKDTVGEKGQADRKKASSRWWWV